MQGAATGAATADPLFTFPVGFRPDVPTTKDTVYAVNNGLAVATVTRVVIRANGTVNVQGGTTPTFDAIRFRAAPA